jgi:hypothetical protein
MLKHANGMTIERWRARTDLSRKLIVVRKVPPIHSWIWQARAILAWVLLV